MRKKTYKAAALVLSFMLLLLILIPDKAYAITGNISIGPQQGTFDQGGTYNVSISISGSEAFSFSGNISVSGGGSFAGADASLQSDGGTFIIVPQANGVSGNIRVSCGGTGSVTIAVSGVMLSADTGEQINVSNSVSVPIRSAADKAAQEEAARKASEEEAARQASIWAEESSRQAEIQASIDAQNASIAEEQSRQASIEAEAAAAYNSSVAESASIEESSRLESASIEESKEEESKRESRSAAAESRSLYESSSKVEATRAFLMQGDYFVPYDILSARERFLFATADTTVPVPAHFNKVSLTINEQQVLAYRLDGFSENIYIVYGCFEDEEAEPALYLYDQDTDRMFPYEALGLDEDDESREVPVAIENGVSGLTANVGPVRKGMNLGLSLLEIFLSILLGAAVLLLVLTFLHKKQEDEAAMAALATAGAGDNIPYAEPDPVSEIQETAVQNDAIMLDAEFTEVASVLEEDSVFEALNEGEEAETPTN